MAQQIAEMINTSGAALEFDTFFAQLRQQREPGGIAPAHRLKLGRIKERQGLFAQHLSDRASFNKYVNAHPLSALIQRKIADEVCLYRGDLARLAEAEGAQDIDSLPSLKAMQESERLLEKYRLLAMASYLDPSYVFSEFPGLAHLCELKGLSDGVLRVNDDRNSEEQRLVKSEWSTAISYFQKRWYALTRETLTGLPFPPVSRLTRLIAPVPYDGSWTEELYTREAVSMGHLPSLDADCKSGGAPHSVRSKHGETETPSSPQDQNANLSGIGCNLSEIYELAGAYPVNQPSGDQQHYTFPGKLGWGEDIFYDYAVMIPVDACDIDQHTTVPEARSLTGAKIASLFAKNILRFISSQHLDSALGGIMANMNAVLDNVYRAQLGAPSDEIRTYRKQLREMAALCRSISRYRMLFSPDTIDWNGLYLALDTALNEFPPIDTVERRLPNGDVVNGEPAEDHKMTLRMIDVGPPLPDEDSYSQQAGIGPGEFSAPDAVIRPAPIPGLYERIGTWYWHYADPVPTGWLKRYIMYLGGTFYKKLVALRDSAAAVRDGLDKIQSGSTGVGNTDVLAEFARFAEGVLNDALMALARLYDDIAEQLPLPSKLNIEGAKRLALMLVYRQFWYPEGYVAGKLVGYKNLLPNQKETFKRRTFIKTTRELTTAQEFAASREEDFSQSSKETQELVKEASSDFNFSAKTTGGFDFLVVSGNLETTTGITRKDNSKAMHNRVAESTMKASFKYNEKREVKIRELTETEDVQEMTTEVQNLNREITANYFYYQLHRQYCVTTELAYIQPVLLRTRDVPEPASIDEKFLSNYAHILLNALPPQLSVDLQETVGDIELLGRTFVRRHSDWDLKRDMYEQFRKSPMPPTPEEQSQWRAQLESLERSAGDARAAYIEAEENYIRARTRLDRVISHVRENICYYMQFLWHESPKVDQDKLMQDEVFNGEPLGEVTRGFMRVGYYGNDEIFEYTGNSLACLNGLMDNLVPGYGIVSCYSDEELRCHPLFQRLKKYYPSDTDEIIIDRIRTQVFIRDPASPEEINNSRRVQVAQDALVVEALPGQVPLLEGFQMAHRMLDVQKACLENEHLRERIKGSHGSGRGRIPTAY
jgi:hypothetical protein